MDRILIVDDDVALCALPAERLNTEGFVMEAVYDGNRGLVRALSKEHALVILDRMLPGIGGPDALRRLRAKSDVPVLILTARGETSIKSWVWKSEQMITCPSHSIHVSSSPVFARFSEVQTVE